MRGGGGDIGDLVVSVVRGFWKVSGNLWERWDSGVGGVWNFVWDVVKVGGGGGWKWGSVNEGVFDVCDGWVGVVRRFRKGRKWDRDRGDRKG